MTTPEASSKTYRLSAFTTVIVHMGQYGEVTSFQIKKIKDLDGTEDSLYLDREKSSTLSNIIRAELSE